MMMFKEVMDKIDPTFKDKMTTSLGDLKISHILKTWPEYFLRTRRGIKRFDLRRRKSGRRFVIGEYIILREYDPDTDKYSGRWDLYYVQFILASEGCESFGMKIGTPFDVLDLIRVIGN